MAQQLGGPGPSHKPEAAAAQRQAVPAPLASPGFSAGRAGAADERNLTRGADRRHGASRKLPFARRARIRIFLLLRHTG